MRGPVERSGDQTPAAFRRVLQAEKNCGHFCPFVVLAAFAARHSPLQRVRRSAKLPVVFSFARRAGRAVPAGAASAAGAAVGVVCVVACGARRNGFAGAVDGAVWASAAAEDNATSVATARSFMVVSSL